MRLFLLLKCFLLAVGQLCSSPLWQLCSGCSPCALHKATFPRSKGCPSCAPHRLTQLRARSPSRADVTRVPFCTQQVCMERGKNVLSTRAQMLLQDFYKPFYCPLHPKKQTICKERFQESTKCSSKGSSVEQIFSGIIQHMNIKSFQILTKAVMLK